MSAITQIVSVLVCLFMLLRAVIQYTTEPDWWIYAPIYGSAAVLNLIAFPASRMWRTATAFVIVLGALHVAFIAWSMHHVTRGNVKFDTFPEGRNLLLIAAAVAMTAGTRLSTSTNHGLLAWMRNAILVAILLLTLPAAVFATCFYSGQLPYCATILAL